MSSKNGKSGSNSMKFQKRKLKQISTRKINK